MRMHGATRDRKETEQEEKNASDDFLKALLTQTVVYEDEMEDYVPAYANPGNHVCNG